MNLVAVPLFHIGALGSVIPLLSLGATLVIMPSRQFDSSRTLDLIQSEGVTSLFMTPVQWAAICEEDGAAERARSLRTVCWGAAPAPVSLLERMAEAFPKAAIGQTEMSPITCVLESDDALRKIGSVGKPVSAVAARIVDDQMNDLPAARSVRSCTEAPPR